MKYNELPTDFTYLVASERDHEFGSVVNAVGFQSIKAKGADLVQGHPSGDHFNVTQGCLLHEYQLLYISSGRGFFYSSKTRGQKIGKGNLLLLVPGERYSYHPDPETGWNEYYIGFEGRMIDNLFEKEILPRESTIIEVGLDDELVKHYRQALELAKADKCAAQQYLSGIVMYLIGMVCYISKNTLSEPEQVEQKIVQAKVIMQENLCKNLDLEILAGEVNLSYSWFRKEFKNYTGYAPAKYLKELKIVRAKELLLGTSRPIKKIASLLGYSSTGYFSTLFKKSTGYTPLEYRYRGRGKEL
jgi:AraC-like DNA-binding protein